MRHGETSWNRQRRLQGQVPTDLSELGIKLTEITSEQLADIPFDLCITSPLKRTKHTAQIMLRDREIPVIDDERIQEISFGIWEGLSILPEKKEIDFERFIKFHEDPFHFQPPEKGETVRQVCDRGGDFLRDITGRKELADKTILVTTHGCAMRAILNTLYDNPDDFWQGGVAMNCAVNIVEFKDGEAKFLAKDKVYYPEEYFVNYYHIDHKKSEEQ